jgi:16S rRNA (guanine527-N7)-methyltransferase
VTPAFRETLASGLATLGVQVGAEALVRLEALADLLVRWNQKVNLTAVTEPSEVAEKHLVDSLALLRLLEAGGVPAAGTLLDLGSGAGLPGLPLAIARPALRVTCCDAVAKKVAFVKAAAAALDLPARALAVRAEGEPDREGLPRADIVVSRALAEPDRWLPLGVRYLAPGGRLVAMLGREADEGRLRVLAGSHRLVLLALDRFTLPASGAARANALFSAA